MPYTVLTNATVVSIDDGNDVTATPDQQIVLEGDRIRDVTDSADTSGAERVVDVRGRTVLPGLIDAHVHVNAWSTDLTGTAERPMSYTTARAIKRMESMLRRGFTTVRDVGGADHGLADAVRERHVLGPRLCYGGKALSQTGGHGDTRERDRDAALADCCSALSLVADGKDEIVRAARAQLRRGAQHIKIMLGGGVASPTDRVEDLQYTTEEIEAAVAVASASGKYVAGHAYTTEAVTRGLEAGVRSIEHGNLMDSSCFPFFKQHNAFYVPTLVTYHAMDAQSHTLRPQMRRKNRVVLEQGLATLEAAARAGLDIAYGSDLLGDLLVEQSTEFRLRSEVQSPAQILRSATVTGAALLGRSDELGAIRPGYLADLVVVDGDPVQDITILADPARSVTHVIRSGEVVHSTA